MSKLINQQAITRLSQGLHQKAKDLVEAEKNRALAEEGRIEVKVEQNISDIAANTSAITKEVQDRTQAVNAVDSKLTAEISRATDAEEALGNRIDDVETSVEEVRNLVDTKTAQTLNDAKAYTDEKVVEINAANSALELRVEANETALGLVDGKISTAKTEAIDTANAHTNSEISKIDAAYKAADVQTLESAKSYADTKIGEAKTTLENSISTVDAKVNSTKVELQGNIDTLAGRVSVNESDIQNLKDAVSNKNNNTIVVNTEDEIATANANPKVGDMAYVISSKRAYIFKGVNALSVKAVPQGWVVFDEITNELDLVDYLKKTDAESTYRKLSEKITEGDLESGLATKINDKADAATLESEIASAKSFATSEAQKEAGIVDGKLTSVKAELQGNIDTVDGKAEANKSAIAILNGDASTTGSVDKKIKDALASYSDTDAVKSILTNVVGSLALSIVEDQVVLSAGGVDGVEISKTSLDMITDAEIDNILSGLN